MKSEFDAMWSRKGGKNDICRYMSRAVSPRSDPYREVELYMTQNKAQLRDMWNNLHKVARRLSLFQAADQLGISTVLLERLCEEGHVEAVGRRFQTDNDWVFDPDIIREMVANKNIHKLEAKQQAATADERRRARAYQKAQE